MVASHKLPRILRNPGIDVLFQRQHVGDGSHVIAVFGLASLFVDEFVAAGMHGIQPTRIHGA